MLYVEILENSITHNTIKLSSQFLTRQLLHTIRFEIFRNYIMVLSQEYTVT